MSEKVTDEMLDNAITRIAMNFQDDARFGALASEAAAAMRPEDSDRLRPFLHKVPAPPADLEPMLREGLRPGAWVDLCHAAIFEIALNMGESALDFIDTYAFGEQDRARDKAVNALCRLAAAGIRREGTLDKLEALLRDHAPLTVTSLYYSMTWIKEDERVSGIFARAVAKDPYAFQRLVLLDLWQKANPGAPDIWYDWLQAAAMGGISHAGTPLPEEGEILEFDPASPPTAEQEGRVRLRLSLRVQAAIQAHRLRGERAVYGLLWDWSESIEDEATRKYVVNYLDSLSAEV